MSSISGTLPQSSLYPDKKAPKQASTGQPAAQPAPTSEKLGVPTQDRVQFGASKAEQKQNSEIKEKLAATLPKAQGRKQKAKREEFINKTAQDIQNFLAKNPKALSPQQAYIQNRTLHLIKSYEAKPNAGKKNVTVTFKDPSEGKSVRDGFPFWKESTLPNGQLGIEEGHSAFRQLFQDPIDQASKHPIKLNSSDLSNYQEALLQGEKVDAPDIVSDETERARELIVKMKFAAGLSPNEITQKAVDFINVSTVLGQKGILSENPDLLEHDLHIINKVTDNRRKLITILKSKMPNADVKRIENQATEIAINALSHDDSLLNNEISRAKNAFEKSHTYRPSNPKIENSNLALRLPTAGNSKPATGAAPASNSAPTPESGDGATVEQATGAKATGSATEKQDNPVTAEKKDDDNKDAGEKKEKTPWINGGLMAGGASLVAAGFLLKATVIGLVPGLLLSATGLGVGIWGAVRQFSGDKKES